MSDTWSDIQALKSRQSSMRERLARRKKEREGLVANITGQSQSATPASAPATSTSSAVSSAKKGINSKSSICVSHYQTKVTKNMTKNCHDGMSLQIATTNRSKISCISCFNLFP